MIKGAAVAALVFVTLASLALPAYGQGRPETASDRPNIVVILADDLGFGDAGAYNPASKVPTPHIDRLAADGLWFTDAHTPSSVCTPTRYGLLTGRYAWRTRLKAGVLYGYDPLLVDTTRLTLASLLKARGYATAAVGKWHLGLGSGERTDYGRPLRPGPNALGFDLFFGIPASLDMPPYVYVENEHLVAPPTDSTQASAMRRKGGGGFWRAGPIAPSFRHIDVLPTLTERAVAYVDARAEAADQQPFFLYLPLSAPHTPWLPTAPFQGKSGAGSYGDFAVQVDHAVGEVLGALERGGLAEHTLVIFTSDNGAHWLEGDIAQYGHRANGPLRGQKADIWEGGHRVPFVVRWPGVVPAGAVTGETVCLTDLMATFAALVGAELPADAGEDSYNLLPVLRGEALEEPLREATVHHSLRGTFAIRQGPWKLIEGRGSGGFTQPAHIDPAPGEPEGQLYHLEEDPAEAYNRYTERPDVVALLSALLDRYRTQGHSRPGGE